MPYRIIWRPRARIRFQHIVTYLEDNYGAKDVENFKELVKQVVNQIEQNPVQFKKSIRKNIHEALITKHNLLLYRVLNEDTVELLVIFDTRQHPRKKPLL